MIPNAAAARDDAGAPTVLLLDGKFAGWRWVWLRSAASRRAEGRTMRHCVGDADYARNPPQEAIFSLRDADDVPHVTLHVDGANCPLLWCQGAVSKANAVPPARYRPLIDDAVRTLAPRLLVNGDPTLPPADGWHEVKDVAYVHIDGGRIRHDTHPAWMAVDCGLNFHCCDGETFVQGPSVRYGRDQVEAFGLAADGPRVELR